MRFFARTERFVNYKPAATLTELANELETDKGTAKELSWSEAWRACQMSTAIIRDARLTSAKVA